MGLSLADIKAAILSGQPLPMGTTVVPFAALRLFRSLLTRASVAASPMARAASSTEEMSRSIGDFTLDVMVEPDATFLVLGPIGEAAPRQMTLLGEDGRLAALALPDPIGDTIQLGLAEDGAEMTLARQLVGDPMTAIFIQ